MAAIGIEFRVSRFDTRLMLATEVSPEDRPILAKFVIPPDVNGKSPVPRVINAIWPFAARPVLYAIVDIAVMFEDATLWFTLNPPLMITFLNIVPPVGRACGMIAIDISKFEILQLGS